VIEVRHDAARRRFVAEIDGKEAHLVYHPVAEGTLDYASTFVPESLRERGIASAVVRAALDYARSQHYRVIPSCWFVQRFVQRHPEYRDLIESRNPERGTRK
jgi:predicted GNAT family acetyltransferase